MEQFFYLTLQSTDENKKCRILERSTLSKSGARSTPQVHSNLNLDGIVVFNKINLVGNLGSIRQSDCVCVLQLLNSYKKTRIVNDKKAKTGTIWEAMLLFVRRCVKSMSSG